MPDLSQVLVPGTWLTLMGSVDTGDAMHAKVVGNEDDLSDSMKIFKTGLEGGNPADGEVGAQPD